MGRSLRRLDVRTLGPMGNVCVSPTATCECFCRARMRAVTREELKCGMCWCKRAKYLPLSLCQCPAVTPSAPALLRLKSLSLGPLRTQLSQRHQPQHSTWTLERSAPAHQGHARAADRARPGQLPPTKQPVTMLPGSPHAHTPHMCTHTHAHLGHKNLVFRILHTETETTLQFSETETETRHIM